jgi:hypothetical protein
MDLVLAPGEALEVLPGLRLVLRLPQHLAVDRNLGVACDHQGARLRRRCDRGGLPARVDDDQLRRLALGELLDLRVGDVEVDPEGLEERLPLR